jgi:hypothetical protein
VVAVSVRHLVVRVFCESGLLRDRRLGHQPLRLGTAEGGDTSHILSSFMKLSRCTSYLRACHVLRESQPRRAREGLKGGQMCAEGV